MIHDFLPLSYTLADSSTQRDEMLSPIYETVKCEDRRLMEDATQTKLDKAAKSKTLRLIRLEMS